MSQLSTRSAVSTILPVGLVFFALFFEAGNLTFPPLLDATSGKSSTPAMVGPLATGVLTSLITVVAVSTSGEGILGLARRIGSRLGATIPLAVYLTIGPLYAIARVTMVTYELATRPVLEPLGIQDSRLVLLIYAMMFMGVSFSIVHSPSHLTDRVGHWLTPALSALLTLLCGVAIVVSPRVERETIEPYVGDPLTNGLTQDYLTMDVLAATVFGIVVVTSLRERGLTSPRTLVRGTVLSGGIAAVLLGLVYVGLAVPGTRIHRQITVDTKDDTTLLRNAASSTLGASGTIILAAVVILAYLTTAVGLMTPQAGYTYTVWPTISFNQQLAVCVVISFTPADLGLSAVLRIAGPLLFLLYLLTIAPVAATLINVVAPGWLKAAYRWCVITVGILKSVSAITAIDWNGPNRLLARTGLWNDSTGWVSLAPLILGVGIVLDTRSGAWFTPTLGRSPSRVQQDAEHAAALQL